MSPSQTVEFKVAAVANEVKREAVGIKTRRRVNGVNSTWSAELQARFSVIPANGASISWPQADAACQASGLLLAAPQNKQDIDQIVEAADTADMIWIGASCTGTCSHQDDFLFKQSSEIRRLLPWQTGYPTSGACLLDSISCTCNLTAGVFRKTQLPQPRSREMVRGQLRGVSACQYCTGQRSRLLVRLQHRHW